MGFGIAGHLCYKLGQNLFFFFFKHFLFARKLNVVLNLKKL